MSEDSAAEQEINESVRAVGLRLRFDRVALRLVERLKSSLSSEISENQTVLVTITAPLKLPAKTAATVEDLIRRGLWDDERQEEVWGNRLRMRRVAEVAEQAPRLLVFVHNPGSDAGFILNLAETHLRRFQRSPRAGPRNHN